MSEIRKLFSRAPQHRVHRRSRPVPWGRKADGCVAATGMIAQPRRHGRRLTGSRPVPYGRRHPGQITLYQVVQHHLRTNLALVVWRRLGQARSAAHSESENPPLCRVWHPRLRWRLFPVARQRTFQRCPLLACAVQRRRLPSGCKSHPATSLQPEAIGAVMEVTKWLKPLM
jgi:hypothetical protein